MKRCEICGKKSELQICLSCKETLEQIRPKQRVYIAPHEKIDPTARLRGRKLG